MSLHQDIGASDCEKPKPHCEILTRHDATLAKLIQLTWLFQLYHTGAFLQQLLRRFH